MNKTVRTILQVISYIIAAILGAAGSTSPGPPSPRLAITSVSGTTNKKTAEP